MTSFTSFSFHFSTIPVPFLPLLSSSPSPPFLSQVLRHPPISLSYYSCPLPSSSSQPPVPTISLPYLKPHYILHQPCISALNHSFHIPPPLQSLPFPRPPCLLPGFSASPKPSALPWWPRPAIKTPDKRHNLSLALREESFYEPFLPRLSPSFLSFFLIFFSTWQRITRFLFRWGDVDKGWLKKKKLES